MFADQAADVKESYWRRGLPRDSRERVMQQLAPTRAAYLVYSGDLVDYQLGNGLPRLYEQRYIRYGAQPRANPADARNTGELSYRQRASPVEPPEPDGA